MIANPHVEVRIKHHPTTRSHLAVLPLACVTMIGATGLAAGGTAGAFVAARLAGTEAAGLPLAMLVLGSAAAAILISQASVRLGRARSLGLGYAIGAMGAAASLFAIGASNFVLLLAGHVLLGAANAAIFLTRYAAIEQGAGAQAVGPVFVATGIGAVLSSSLLGPSGRVAAGLGLASDSGLYLVAVMVFGIAAVGVALLPRDRPSPRNLGQSRSWIQLRDGLTRPVCAALVILGAGNFVMVSAMTITPVYLHVHGLELAWIGTAIAFHVALMFGPAPVSGWLADHIGPARVAVIGALSLGIAGTAGALVISTSHVVAILLLALLGLGWNFSTTGGTLLLASSVSSEMRPRVEGTGEVTMNVAAAAAGPLAGTIANFAGVQSIWFFGAAISAVALVAVHRLGLQSRS